MCVCVGGGCGGVCAYVRERERVNSVSLHYLLFMFAYFALVHSSFLCLHKTNILEQQPQNGEF